MLQPLARIDDALTGLDDRFDTLLPRSVDLGSVFPTFMERSL